MHEFNRNASKIVLSTEFGSCALVLRSALCATVRTAQSFCDLGIKQKILSVQFTCPMAQLLARRTIDWEVKSSNQASDSDKCHRVAKGRDPLLANSTSTEMRHPPALSLSTLTLVGMGEISISIHGRPAV